MSATAPPAGQFPHASGQFRRLGLERWGRWALLLYATLMLALGWSYAVWRIHEDRLLTLQTSHQQLATLAKSLASQLSAMVGDGVGAAGAGANILQQLRPGTDAQGALSQMLTGGDYVRALFVARDKQFMIANAPGESHSVADMPWLEQMMSSGQTVWVGQVIQSRGGPDLVVPIARRIDTAGTSRQWAGALLRLNDLVPVYMDLLSSQASVSIVSEQGRMLMQIPALYSTNTVNLELGESEAFTRFRAFAPQPLILFVAPHPVTLKPRQYAVARIPGLPLLATGGRNIEDALKDWRDRRKESVLFFLATTLVVYVLAYALQNLLNRRFLALERSEERYELAAAATNDGLFERESSNAAVYLTSRALEMLGLPGDVNLHSMEELRSLVHPDDLPAMAAAFRGNEAAHERIDVQARLRSGATYRWFRIRGQATWNDQGTADRLAGAITDIHDTLTAQAAVTEARQAELDAKDSLARELLGAQEQERKRLSAELHDGIGQNLSLLRNRAVMLQRSDLSTLARSHVQTLIDLATDSIEDLRRVAQNLRPLHLEELGIVAALRALLEKLREGSGIQVNFRLENIDDMIFGPVATHVYRIVQEATNNILRHSGARNLWIETIRDIDCVIVSVRDDGRGIPGDAVGKGLGTFSMRERAHIIGGTLTITSAEGAGTHLTLRIPIRTEQDSNAAEDVRE
jgi:two-component system, NarL family, sensor histidine kinase UhpB